MATGDVYRLQAIWRASATSPAAVNDFYFVQENEESELDAPADLVQAFILNCEIAYTNLVTAVLELVQYNVSLMPDVASVYQVGQIGIVGGASSDPLPPRVAGLIRKYTGVPGRTGRGYFYIPPSSENQSGGSGPNFNWIGNANTFCDKLLVDMRSGAGGHNGWILTHYMPKTGNFTVVTRLLPSNRWASQNDRKRLY